MTQRQASKRSPLKSSPPRQAGQSVQAKMDDYLVEHLLNPLFATAAFGICALAFWVTHLTHASILLTAWIMTALFLISIPLGILKIKQSKEGFRKLQQGRDGERIVGAMLEELRKDGYRVLHDVPDAKNQSFNIDHVVIGPGGVFAIETKTFSKVGTPNEKIRFEKGELIIPGIGRGTRVGKIIDQVQANARFIHKHLAETTGHKVQVQPVVIFPGWYVNEPRSTERSQLPAWVLNENRISAWIGNSPSRLSQEDINLYTH